MLDTSARLLRLLTTLQRRAHWSGQELADRLEVTTRTLRRDVDRLRALGYTVHAGSGPGGGYRLGGGKELPPLVLDDDEAVAVAVALRSAADGFSGIGETAVFVLVKLTELFPRRLRRRLDAVQAMTVSIGDGPRVDPDVLMTLAVACRDGEEASFEYRTHDGESGSRRVEPLRLAHSGNRRWYLVAWDTEREAWRTFRVDRITTTPVLGPRFAPRTPPEDVERYVAESLSVSPYRLQARVRLSGSAEALAARVPPWVGVIEPVDDDTCLLTSGADSVEALACQLVLAGVDFELMGPEALRPQLLAVAERLARGVASAPRERAGG